MNNLSINVLSYEENTRIFFPIYVSKHMGDKTVNLLLIDDGEKQHYITITSISALLSGMQGVTKHKNMTHYCFHCLHG